MIMKKAFKKGIVFVDKPAGITSFELVEKVREILGIRKAGHSGTLDMAVTGFMLVALEEAVKAMPLLSGLDKEYEGITQVHGDPGDSKIREACRSFVGNIIQTPPRRSAVKREPREREIYSLDITRIKGRNVEFRVRCQAGTYIRKLCSDIGEKLGCGAHMIRLRRIGLGPFSIDECAALDKLMKSDAKPLEEVLERIGIKKIFIKDDFVGKIRNGLPVRDEWAEKTDKDINKGELIGIYSGKEIIAIARYMEKELARTDRVFN
jgi:H/ACA ribonucleoprotein complex subunit 4